MSELKSAVFKVYIEAPIQSVWDAMTREKEVLPHFYNSVMHTPELAAGSPLRMCSPDEKFTAVVGEILEVDAPRRFVHTTMFTQLEDAPSKVTYELEEKNGGTELIMLLADVPAGSKSEGYMMSGGPFITEILKRVIDTGRPPLKHRLFLVMIGLFGFMTPKVFRTENWSFDRKIS